MKRVFGPGYRGPDPIKTYQQTNVAHMEIRFRQEHKVYSGQGLLIGGQYETRAVIWEGSNISAFWFSGCVFSLFVHLLLFSSNRVFRAAAMNLLQQLSTLRHSSFRDYSTVATTQQNCPMISAESDLLEVKRPRVSPTSWVTSLWGLHTIQNITSLLLCHLLLNT